MLTRRLVLPVLAAPALIGAARAEAPLPVVASFSILADMTARLGGERVAVTSLVGPDGDAHAYQPSPADGRALAGARLIVVNGLGFEGWIARLIRSSGARAPVVTATEGIAALPADSHGHSHGHSHAADPHAWQDASLARAYVATIAKGLAAADPAGAAGYAERARAYDAEIAALDAEIKAKVAAIPPERRRLITTHDAFRYFQRAYGIAFLSLRGVASDAEPSAQDLARIVRQVRREAVPAVFLENVSDPRAMERIAAETGARIGGRLYSDALSPPDGPAATYLAMMRHNLGQIVGALAQG